MDAEFFFTFFFVLLHNMAFTVCLARIQQQQQSDLFEKKKNCFQVVLAVTHALSSSNNSPALTGKYELVSNLLFSLMLNFAATNQFL